MEKPDVTLDDFLDALVEYYSDYELAEGEFTVNTILDRMAEPVDRGRITTDLHNRVRKGELGSKRERINGKSCYVFWRIKNPAG